MPSVRRLGDPGRHVREYADAHARVVQGAAAEPRIFSTRSTRRPGWRQRGHLATAGYKILGSGEYRDAIKQDGQWRISWYRRCAAISGSRIPAWRGVADADTPRRQFAFSRPRAGSERMKRHGQGTTS